MVAPLKLWLTLLLYLFAGNLLLLSWVFPVVELEQGYQVGVFEVRIKTAYEGVYTTGQYGPACLYCGARTHDSDCALACGDFRTAAVSYFSTSLIAFILLVVSGINLLAVGTGCKCCLSLKLQLTHYLLVPIYAFSVLLYMLISGALGQIANLSLLSGALDMLGTTALLLLALPLFCLLRKDLTNPPPTPGDSKESELVEEF